MEREFAQKYFSQKIDDLRRTLRGDLKLAALDAKQRRRRE